MRERRGRGKIRRRKRSKEEKEGDTWLAQSEAHETLDLEVMSSRPM